VLGHAGARYDEEDGYVEDPGERAIADLGSSADSIGKPCTVEVDAEDPEMPTLDSTCRAEDDSRPSMGRSMEAGECDAA
jgi:hypothetical protein